MTENYLSGKKRSLKLGVSDHSENLTSLEVIGGVGIGTTNADKRSLYVVGNTEITGVLTANSYSGDGSGLTGVAATDHVATFDLVVAGISTFHDDVRVTAGGIDVTSGIVSATGLDIGTNGIDVDGQTDLDELVVAGVSTFSAAIDSNAGANIVGGLTLDQLNVTGVSTFDSPGGTTIGGGGLDVTGIVTATKVDVGTGGLDVDGQTDLDELVVAGVSTFSKAVDINAGIDVDGQTDLDELVVAGVATFTNSLKVDGAVDIGTGGLDVDGETQLDELVVAGVSTFTGNIVAATAEFSGNVTIGGTLTVEDKTNVDSIGLITARTGVRVTAGGIDVTAGVSTFSDTVKFNGAVDIGTGGVDIDGQTDLDELIVAGVTTFSNDIHVGTAITIHAGNVHATGIISATKFVGDGSQITNLPGINTVGTSNLTDVNVSGTTTTAQLYVSGIGTAVKFDVSTGGLDVDGQTDLDELIVSGVSTFSGNINANGDITGDGNTNITGINSIFVAKKLIHTGDEDTSVTFNDNMLSIVAGGTSRLVAGTGGIIDGVIVTGDLQGNGNKFNINSISGQANFTGISSFTAYPSIDADNEIQVGTAIQLGKAGVITATSFSGDGSNLTGIAATDHVSTFDLVVAGISTFNDDVRVLGGGVNVTGVSTFNDNVHLLDNDKLLLGGSAGTYDGLEVYHDSNHSYVNDTGTGNLYIGGNQIFINDSSQTKVSAIFNPDTNTQLKYNNSTKFETTAVGATVFGNFKSTTLHVAGISTLTGNVNFVGSLNNVSASGISSFVQLDVSTGGLDVDGQTDLDELAVAGLSTFNNTVLMSSNKQLNFRDANASILHESSMLKIQTSGSGGNIRLKTNASGGDSYDIVLNGGSSGDLLRARGTGDVNINNSLTVGAGLSVAGVSTFLAYPSIDADNEIQVGTAIQLGKAGVVTATTFSGALSGNATSATTATNVTVADESSDTSCNVLFVTAATGDLGPKSGSNLTFNSDTGALSATSFSGDGSNLTGIGTQGPDGAFNGITVSGVSTFHDDVRITGGGINAVGVITATSFSGDGSNLSGVGTQGINVQAKSLVVSGISTFYNDVKIVGGGSTAGNQITIGATTLNDGTLTFDGTAGQLFSISNNLTDGSIFSVNDVSGMPSIDVGAAGTIQLAPYGSGELVGIGTTRPTSKLDVVGDVQVVGVVTATSFSGDGSALTNVPGATDGSFIGLNVTGITTLGDDVRVTAGGINAVGVITATSFSGDGSNLSGVGTQGADGSFRGLVVAGVTTFHNAITNSGDFYMKGPAAGDGDMFLQAQSGTTNARFYANSGATFYFAGNERIRVDTLGINVGSSHLAVGATIAMSGQACFAGVSTFGGMLHVGTAITMQANTGIISATKLMPLYRNANTIVGADAGEALAGSTGHNNTLVGYKAGDDINSGAYNVFVGREAGHGATGAAGAVAIGYQAAYSGCNDYLVAIGYEAAKAGGNYGIAVGYAALKAQSSAQGNIGIGHRAAEAVTGNHNTVIGRNACYTGVNNLTSGTNNIVIGYNAEASASNVSNQITLGNSDVNQLRLPGIGVSFNTGGNGYFTGVVTAITGSFTNVSAIGGNYTGVVTASSFSGDGSALTNLPASASTGEFYVGFTSSVTMNAASYETTGHTFPSTASKTYTIDSIMASNIANVGVGTTVNLIASISSNSGVAAGTTEQAYLAYNIPIAAGGAVELIKEPIVANPNDIVKLWATDSTYTGISSAIQVHMTYTQQDSTDFFGKYAANTSIGSTTIIGIHTAGPTYAAALQSIHITNRSDAGAFPVDIMLTNSTGVVTTYLVKNLVIPKYSSVEILERPKRMETGSSLGVKVQQTGTIDVIVSGKTYS